jgi:ribonuclease III
LSTKLLCPLENNLLVGYIFLYHLGRISPVEEKQIIDLESLQISLAYSFNDINLLRQAMTHRSFVNEHLGSKLKHNERLEFLGDAVLNLSLSTMLLDQYPDLPEGHLSKIRAGQVNEKSLADLSLQLGLGGYLLIGKGEERTGGREKPSLLADTFEAVLGAIYLDGGFNSALSFIKSLFQSQFEKANTFSTQDYKTLLQEYCQGKLKTVPDYKVFREEGPDHKKIFFVEVIIQGQVISIGKGRTKKDAQQKAAEKALGQLENTPG